MDLILTHKNIMIIPKPLKFELKENSFSLNDKTIIAVSNESKISGELLANQLRKSTGLPLNVATSNLNQNIISLNLIDDEKFGDEGYELFVASDKISLNAKTTNGLFYACQSLRQLLPPENFRGSRVDGIKWTIPCAYVFDKPSFKWRGLMLDSCRHFWNIDFVKKFIDLMAIYKFNVFHWHLTEDQGWRIEINKYPKLAEVAAWRIENGKKYGGFYTQEQVKEIVDYASERAINVLPEIEMPGHSVAAIAAYPKLSCSGEQVEVPTNWGVLENVYCAGNEFTFEFLENVIDEVVSLFPFEYFHIGGDECPKTAWKKCPKCQQRIKNENLNNEDELQSYFIKRMEKFINLKGKRLIGWDEILEGGLAPHATVMSWRGTKGGIAAAKQKHDVVMSPTTHCYFDYPQKADENIDIDGATFTPTEKVFEFNPIPAELSDEEAKFILGGQGNLWTEHIATTARAEEMLYPRACALSEKIWSDNSNDNYEEFKKRLDLHYKILDILNVNYFKE